MTERIDPEEPESDDGRASRPSASTASGLRDDGLDVIPLETCLRLLAEGAVGLLALAGTEVRKAPDVRPVNFALVDRIAVMRTGRGRIYEGACRGEPASLVISETDRLEHSGWSVVVSGRLSLANDDESLAEARVRPWARVEKREVVALSMDQISGRRLARRIRT
jgi:nitroimidazol reductase NimA-like FMN-containing flavoprotein (pyridoxamine 5'-phosphate oxidase superfamily)